MICQICRESNGTKYRALEMMFGLRHEFSYFECNGCGCLQLVSPPADMGTYYPANYYSFSQREPRQHTPAFRKTGVRRWLASRRNEAQILDRGGLWGAIASVRPFPGLRLPDEVRGVPGLKFTSRILDVGCGGGALLVRLAELGFTNLTGADPFLSADQNLGGLVRLRAVPVEQIDDGPYDLVMFHHALEHIPNQWSTMRATARLLAPNGLCLIRIPTASSNVWEKYRTDWVELDAPRHFVIHSQNSLRILANGCGLQVSRLTCEEDGFGYWGSELYRRGLSLFDFTRGVFRQASDAFTAEDIMGFQAKAKDDNKTFRGGRLIVHLVKGQSQM